VVYLLVVAVAAATAHPHQQMDHLVVMVVLVEVVKVVQDLPIQEMIQAVLLSPIVEEAVAEAEQDQLELVVLVDLV